MKIVFSSFPDFSGNSKTFYNYVKNKNNKIELYWVIFNEEVYEKKFKMKNGFVLYKSEEFNMLMEQVHMIFDTHGLLITDKKKGQYYINLWHGFGPKKIGYLLEKKNLAPQDLNYLDLMQTKTDYVIVPSEFWKLVVSARFYLEQDRVKVLGSPRHDDIVNSKKEDILRALNISNWEKYDKIIVYLPTFRNGAGREQDGEYNTENILNLEYYDEKLFFEFLEKNNYLLVIKYHPSDQNKNIQSEHPNVVCLSELDLTISEVSLQEFLVCSDILISDYSSIYIEYLLLDRPILFFHKDIEKYEKNRGILFESEEFWFPGPKTVSLDDCIFQIQKLLHENEYYLNERVHLKKLMFGFDGDGSSKRLYDFLFPHDKISENLVLYMDVKTELNNKMEVLKIEKNELIEIIDVYKNEAETNLEKLNSLENQLNNIQSSKSWKFMKKIHYVKNKILRK